MKHTLLGIYILSALIAGCVSQKKYKELQSGYDQLISRNNELAKIGQECNLALSVCKNKVGSLEDQLTAERANLASLQSALDKCLTSYNQGNVNISKLLDEINASNKYIQRLIEARHKSDSLLVVLTNNLTRSLSQNELKDVDVLVEAGRSLNRRTQIIIKPTLNQFMDLINHIPEEK